MKIEEIQEAWKEDCKIDDTHLDREALRIPTLHSNYYDVMLIEKHTHRILTESKKVLVAILTEFYAKTLTADELDFYGLEYGDKKVLKPDIPRAIETHPEIIKLNMKIAKQEDKIEFLKSIMQALNSRGFNIRDAISFKRFQAGL